MEKFSVKKPFTVVVAVIMVLMLGFVSVKMCIRDRVKGGFTTLAGRCIVAFAQQDGHNYGLVILGCDTPEHLFTCLLYTSKPVSRSKL